MAGTPDKIQFHPGFYGAVELEFRLEATELEFNIEYNLSKEPLRVDLLVIGKSDDIQLANEVGRIFRRYNVIEYKSPDDGLTIDDFFKTIGYACLYKSLGKTVNQIPEKQITVSLFRDSYPQELFNSLKESGRTVVNKFPGVYYIDGNIPFRLQIVVMSRLERERHSALRILSKNAKEEDVRRFLEEAAAYENPGDRQNADAVFQVSISANQELYEKIRGDETMCKAMEQLMQDVIVKREKEAADKAAKIAARNASIAATVDTCRDFELSDREIVEKLRMKYGLTEEKALEYVSGVVMA